MPKYFESAVISRRLTHYVSITPQTYGEVSLKDLSFKVYDRETYPIFPNLIEK